MLEGERSILTIHVVWHPQYESGLDMANSIFERFCSDPKFPAKRGLGIPVRFQTSTTPSEPPEKISFDDSDSSLVVVLIDDEFVASDGWGEYLADLIDSADFDHHRVMPVAITDNAFGVRGCQQINFVRLYECASELRSSILVNRIAHDLCRILDPDRQVNVFISHAKEDGVSVARQVQTYIHQTTPITDFFDATSIPAGSSFAHEIESSIGESALLIVLTDGYSSREWCRLEVLEAKRVRAPILVLAAVREGEARAFPYIGNVPVVTWSDGSDSNMERMVGGLLQEVLRSIYFPRWINAVCRLNNKTLARDAFAYPPELLTALHLHIACDGAPIGEYIYPDPPLGAEELALLKGLDPTLRPITPTFLVAS